MKSYIQLNCFNSFFQTNKLVFSYIELTLFITFPKIINNSILSIISQGKSIFPRLETNWSFQIFSLLHQMQFYTLPIPGGFLLDESYSPFIKKHPHLLGSSAPPLLCSNSSLSPAKTLSKRPPGERIINKQMYGYGRVNLPVFFGFYDFAKNIGFIGELQRRDTINLRVLSIQFARCRL